MYYLIIIGISFVIALIIAGFLKAGMKNVEIKREAGVYVSRALNLTRRHDQYTHTTTTKRKLESNAKTPSGSR